MGRGVWIQAFGLVVGGMGGRREDVGIVERIVVGLGDWARGMGWDAADFRRRDGGDLGRDLFPCIPTIRPWSRTRSSTGCSVFHWYLFNVDLNLM